MNIVCFEGEGFRGSCSFDILARLIVPKKFIITSCTKKVQIVPTVEVHERWLSDDDALQSNLRSAILAILVVLNAQDELCARLRTIA
jgi:hypothetical protein